MVLLFSVLIKIVYSFDQIIIDCFAYAFERYKEYNSCLNLIVVDSCLIELK